MASVSPDPEAVESSKQAAESAVQWLVKERSHRGYVALNPSERKRVVRSFVLLNKVVYWRAFDLVRVAEGEPVDFSSDEKVETAVRQKRIVLIEVKATKNSRGDHFRGHFFGLTTAELLVAQGLAKDDLYKFAFVNASGDECYEVTLAQIYARAKAIYPTWSIALTPPVSSYRRRRSKTALVVARDRWS